GRPEASYVRNNNGGGSWTVLALPGGGLARAASDVDGDGDTDLVGTGEWYLNDGDGNFTVVPADALSTVGSVRIGDVNGDGIDDVVIGAGSTLVAAINDGSGLFTAITSAGIATHIDLADFDGDGDLDVLGMPEGIQVHVNLNDGSGNFTSQQLFTGLAGTSRAIIARDLNGDGHMDVVFARSDGYTHVTYYCLNAGNGTLGPATIADPTAESTAALLMADMNGDLVPDLVNARFHSLAWQENFFFNAFRLRGSVYIDYGMNATLDPIDQKVPFRLVQSDATDLLVWTNSAGDYDLPADTGTWQVWHDPPANFSVINDPDTLVATLSNDEPIATGLDFGLVPTASEGDQIITVTASGPYRCDWDVMKWIVVQNTGGFVGQEMLLDYYVHPSVTVNEIMPQPDSVANGHIYWSIDSLGWFQSFVAHLQITMGPVFSEAAFGYTLTFTDPELTITAEPDTFTVLCAYDPNDKLVTPVGYGVHGAVPVDIDWLDYTIRFQNTGIDTAFTVVVRDSLHDALDHASMQVLAASHPLTAITVDPEGLATFRFDQIQLPDSVVNEPASHGYVRFRIRPLPGRPHLTTITNTAAIHFDWNPPIITNTTLNTLVDCELHSATIDASQGDVAVASAGALYQWYLDGMPLPGQNGAELDLEATGEYTVMVTSEYGCVAVSEPYLYITTAVQGAAAAPFTLQPNPFTDQLVLGFAEPLPMGAHIELLDAQGRLARTLSASGRSTVTLHREGLAPGLYLLRVAGPGGTLGEQRVVVQ
ncbi:MAG TPA: T9SS type A sorting domain-containing protein, partial [Flavobacteriales bacterium]|nr:T9SS type A sorting domain-containing protein [Flavobacteriales bacterium]